MRKILLSAILLFLCLAALTYAGDQKFNTNTVYFDTVTAKPGEHFAVKAYLYNVDTLSGLQVPIFFRSETINLWCDSVSVEGSRCKYFMFDDIKLPQTEKDDKVAYFSFIDTVNPKVFVNPLPPGDGLLATIYFTAPKDCPEGTVSLIRGMIPHPHISFIFSLWDPMGDEIDSEFIPSEIIIKK